jgi:hypothetical protein
MDSGWADALAAPHDCCEACVCIHTEPNPPACLYRYIKHDKILKQIRVGAHPPTVVDICPVHSGGLTPPLPLLYPWWSVHALHIMEGQTSPFHCAPFTYTPVVTTKSAHMMDTAQHYEGFELTYFSNFRASSKLKVRSAGSLSELKASTPGGYLATAGGSGGYHRHVRLNILEPEHNDLTLCQSSFLSQSQR